LENPRNPNPQRERGTILPAKSLAYASGYDQHHLQVAALVLFASIVFVGSVGLFSFGKRRNGLLKNSPSVSNLLVFSLFVSTHALTQTISGKRIDYLPKDRKVLVYSESMLREISFHPTVDWQLNRKGDGT
jgi:hypothetical protein